MWRREGGGRRKKVRRKQKFPNSPPWPRPRVLAT